MSSEPAWLHRSTFPVSFPSHGALTKPSAEFDRLIADELSRRHADSEIVSDPATGPAASDTFTVVSAPPSAAGADLDAGSWVVEDKGASSDLTDREAQDHPFIHGLKTFEELKPELPDMTNMMLTENASLAYRSTANPVLDLFYEMEDVISGPRLRELLHAAWKSDPSATLKTIFNARSIHLGKSCRHVFYRAAGWLAQNHPLTLVANLRWLSRPVIPKKIAKDGEDSIVFVERDPEHDKIEIAIASEFDVENGVAHGYWKDLLNILMLAVTGKLDVLSNPRDVLNIHTTKAARKEYETEAHACEAAAAEVDVNPVTEPNLDRKEAKRRVRDARHDRAVRAFNENPVYRAIHMTVARLFAAQLQADLTSMRSVAGKPISLCGNTIAETMYPRESLASVLSPNDDRTTYLLHAREAYRRDIAALRRQLRVVERDITAKTYEKIAYERIPSLAMHRYTRSFIRNDLKRFESYIENVAAGKARISGATLLPSTLVKETISRVSSSDFEGRKGENMLRLKIMEIENKTADCQWKALVQRMKDSGSLSSSIAVCDTSGSMLGVRLADGTRAIDSAIGLSLLIAEVTEPPFGGCLISFSENPQVHQIDPSKPFATKIRQVLGGSCGMSTNFISVFEDLILPMAIQNKLTQEQMVKRIFVFSDMHFDDAEVVATDHYEKSPAKLSTSYERIQALYAAAGYEVPELIFWNLGGGRAGYIGHGGDPTAPKPVTAFEKGVSLVSGYSQGMLKLFLDSCTFSVAATEKKKRTKKSTGRGEVVDSADNVEAENNPNATLDKLIRHDAYRMLQVLD